MTRNTHISLAEQITDRLFINGMGEHVERLVIELRGGKNSGGWCRGAVIDHINRILGATNSHASDKALIAELVEAIGQLHYVFTHLHQADERQKRTMPENSEYRGSIECCIWAHEIRKLQKAYAKAKDGAT